MHLTIDSSEALIGSVLENMQISKRCKRLIAYSNFYLNFY